MSTSQEKYFVRWKSLEIQARNQTTMWRRFLKVFLNLLLIFMTVVFFWGFITIIFNPNTRSTQINNNLDGTLKVYTSNIFFEIEAGFTEVFNDTTKINNYKRHIVYFDGNNGLSEYQYFRVNTLGDMWQVSTSLAYVLFVLPISWLTTKLAFILGWSALNSEGTDQLGVSSNLFALIGAIAIVTFSVKGFTFYSVIQQRRNQEKMEKIKTTIALIKEKYKNKTGFAQKQQERVEISNIYRQNNINPLASSLQGFAFAPLLFTLFIVVRYARIMKESSTDNFALTTSIYDAFKEGAIENFRYLILGAIYLCITISDILYETFFKKKPKKVIIQTEEMKKNNNRQKIIKWAFRGLFFWLFFTVPTGTSIYWIFSGFFDTGQKIFLEFFDQFKKRKLKGYQAKIIN